MGLHSSLSVLLYQSSLPSSDFLTHPNLLAPEQRWGSVDFKIIQGTLYPPASSHHINYVLDISPASLSTKLGTFSLFLPCYKTLAFWLPLFYPLLHFPLLSSGTAILPKQNRMCSHSWFLPKWKGLNWKEQNIISPPVSQAALLLFYLLSLYFFC